MPCTTILVGKNASHDGSTIIARNDDGGFEAKRLLAHPAREKASTYKTVISHLTVELPKNAMRYTDCPNVNKSNGVWPACGINEANDRYRDHYQQRPGRRRGPLCAVSGKEGAEYQGGPRRHWRRGPGNSGIALHSFCPGRCAAHWCAA